MRWSHIAFLAAAVIAGLAMQKGVTTKSTILAVENMNIADLQIHASKNLPVTAIADLY